MLLMESTPQLFRRCVNWQVHRKVIVMGLVLQGQGQGCHPMPRRPTHSDVLSPTPVDSGPPSGVEEDSDGASDTKTVCVGNECLWCMGFGKCFCQQKLKIENKN